jgi:triosephosphate isomerase
MKTLMAANWKMHKTAQEAEQTSKELVSKTSGKLPDDREVLLIPPFTALHAVQSAIWRENGYLLGAQNFYPAAEGAFTGEISPAMLQDHGCTSALVGHSERRHVLFESDAFIAHKVSFGLEKGLNIILCIGETLDERTQGRVKEVLERQLASGLSDVDPGNGVAERLSIAYEPVWAIGTGHVAGETEIAEAHDLVREELTKLFDSEGESVRILYGGSVKPDNIASILDVDNVNGVLVGGASLTPDSFSDIVLG